MATMTAGISEHLKKVDGTEPRRTWKVALDEIDGALASRLLVRRAPAVPSEPRLLNLGCGPVKYPNWVNADSCSFHWIVLRPSPLPDWIMDATKAWKCPDAYWDGIST
jgi:hypothetical protein